MNNETEFMKSVCDLWNDVIAQTNKAEPEAIPAQIAKQIASIDRRIRNLAENWNPDTSKLLRVKTLLDDIKCIIDDWNRRVSRSE